MKYDSLSTVVSRVDVGASLAGLEHCRDISLFSIISGWERSETTDEQQGVVLHERIGKVPRCPGRNYQI